MGLFLRHLELTVTAVSLALLSTGGWLTRVEVPGGGTRLLFLAGSICFAQGSVLWVVRSKQRSARDQTLLEVQTMLQDVVNNQLVVIQMADQINRRKPGAVPEAAVERSVGVIYEAIASLSHESLHAWTLKYRKSKDRYRVPTLMDTAKGADGSTADLSGRGPVTMASRAPQPTASQETDALGVPGSAPISSAVSSAAVQSDVRLTDAPDSEAEHATLKSLKVPEKK